MGIAATPRLDTSDAGNVGANHEGGGGGNFVFSQQAYKSALCLHRVFVNLIIGNGAAANSVYLRDK